jgi:mannose-6-phosphate isomerase-like protein (cupin superfamily)
MLRRCAVFTKQFEAATVRTARRYQRLRGPRNRLEINMVVIEQNRPEPTVLAGIAHATWAGSAQGLTQLSLWRQSLAPASATPPHSHDCDEVVLCLGGWGEVHIDGQAHRFGADTTVVLPKGLVHQLFNVGAMPLEVLGIFSTTPVGTRLPDGQAIELPWQS